HDFMGPAVAPLPVLNFPTPTFSGTYWSGAGTYTYAPGYYPTYTPTPTTTPTLPPPKPVGHGHGHGKGH
ncbi:MAG: hypothetical protein QOG85_2562, partial [Gaiellaceae bacterium]|nr:hypothetical protein [Gaiellaceae bacterium]